MEASSWILPMNRIWENDRVSLEHEREELHEFHEYQTNMTGKSILKESRIKVHNLRVGLAGDHVDLFFTPLLVVQSVQEGALRRQRKDLTLVLIERQNLVRSVEFVEIVNEHVGVDDYLIGVQTIDHHCAEKEEEKAKKREH